MEKTSYLVISYNNFLLSSTIYGDKTFDNLPDALSHIEIDLKKGDELEKNFEQLTKEVNDIEIVK